MQLSLLPLRVTMNSTKFMRRHHRGSQNFEGRRKDASDYGTITLNVNLNLHLSQRWLWLTVCLSVRGRHIGVSFVVGITFSCICTEYRNTDTSTGSAQMTNKKSAGRRIYCLLIPIIEFGLLPTCVPFDRAKIVPARFLNE